MQCHIRNMELDGIVENKIQGGYDCIHLVNV